jgi:LPXTG-motif cell wall-anchored protein
MARRLATMLAALVLSLAAPAAALAQGAGDDQYSDPFGSGQNDDAGEEQQPEPEPEPAAPEPAPTPAATASQQEPAGEEQLPYTGADEGLVALAGVVMLAGGIALRLRLRREPTGARPTGHSVSSGVPSRTPSGRSPRRWRRRSAGRA